MTADGEAVDNEMSGGGEERAVVLNTKPLFKLMVDKRASDLFFTSYAPIKIKIEGQIFPVNKQMLTPDVVRQAAYGLMTQEQIEAFNDELEIDFAISEPGLGRFRVNVFHQRGNPAMVLRYITADMPRLDDLGLPEILKDLMMLKRGLILMVGATGSGKSTTIASMINYRNENSSDHIITIEDPIEFVHESKRSLVNQREVHRDTLGFSEALRSALREDPDVVLVGEMRDLETIRLALTAAETGHLVFGTLHTSSAAKTIDRIVDVFPSAEKEMVRTMLSESLRAAISQSLLKRIGGGRVAAHEIMIGTPAIRNLIREGKIAQMYSAIQTGQKDGMQTLDQCLTELLQKGIVTKEEARFRAQNKDAF